MLRISLMFSTLLLASCMGDYDNNEDLFNEVAFIVTDDKGNNLFDPSSTKKIPKNNIKLYYIDSNGVRKSQNSINTNPQSISVKCSPKTGTYYLSIRINLNPNKEGYAKTIIDFGSYGDAEINAKVDAPLPLALPMGGAIGYEELFLNGEKILSNTNQPIELILTLKSSK